MKEIILTQGKIALVDDDKFEELNSYKWQAQKNGRTFYAVRSLKMKNGKRPKLWMHRAIFGFPQKGLEIDHKDGDGLRNLRSNLRFVTHRQNQQNIKNIERTSQFPGVSWGRERGKWEAQIKINGSKKSLGRFISETEAHNAYCKKVEALGEIMIQS